MIVVGRLGGECKTACDCESHDLACPSCEGKGCSKCGETGYFSPPCCGHSFAEEMGMLIHFADLYEKGLPPVAGGALDQSHWFTKAARYYWSEKERAKSEALKNVRS